MVCACGCGEETSGPERRWVLGHHTRVRYNSPKWLKEDRGYRTPCWIWQRAKNPNGYGLTKRPNRRRGMAHKLIWEEQHGLVPPGHQLHHRCEQTDCVNPAHLVVLTALENNRRKSNVRLTMGKAREIRALRAKGTTQASLARQYDVHLQTIKSVLRETTWRE